LDGTVLGDPEGEAAFRAWARERPLTLAYATGRSRANVLGLVAEGRLPRPDFLVGDVGTTLHDLSDPADRLGAHFLGLAPAGWPAEAIRAAGQAERTPLQGPEGQGPYKCSFYWDGADDSLNAFLRRLAPLPGWRLVPSAKRYLDVLPRTFGKDQAVRFLAAALGLALTQVLVAGDMGNDADMFRIGACGILPANALDEAVQAAAGSVHYRSRLPAGRGLLDGLRHFGR
jgi:hydroxymethylpyrimidine pyrophosphatase-like HAD family hydrolase